ncbi:MULTISPECIES: hypothetical protein [Halorussus]|uniref:hypothetical protein n=1 Tax=Halorussus TaxID=1070314 RepID=UPI00209E411A|nr:hypothetical protein [Halorussus vallis]USZ76744.1 hypothetical protein NGM07_05310 [Halorussus vallis]
MTRRLRIGGAGALSGGALLALVPALDGAYPGYVAAVALASPLLLVGATALYLEHRTVLSHPEEVGFGALALGLLVVTAAAVVYAAAGGGSVAVGFVVGLPAVAGAAVAAVGSALFARGLSRTGAIPRWLALLVALAPFVDPVANGLLAAVVPFGVSITGLAWVALGVHRWQESESTRRAHGAPSR